MNYLDEFEFQIKENEVIFFVDFNCTLVDYDKMSDREHIMGAEAFSREPVATSRYLKTAIENFVKKTGLSPVICVVTNSSENFTDYGCDYPLVLADFYKIFLRRRSGLQSPIAKYMKYIVLKENDKFFKVNHDCTSLDDAYEVIYFDDEALKIRMADSFHKCESCKRMLKLLDPAHKSKYMFFAGDSIEDDYPMKYARTEDGLSIFSVRPGNRRTISWQTKARFCKAKGHEFTSVNRHGRKIRCFDDCFENPRVIDPKTGKPKKAAVQINIEDKKALENFDDGDTVILTQKNSSGLAEGIDKVANLIAASKEKSTSTFE